MISVIVPVYNVEKYLSTCIESILAQTYTDFEVILINDGSTDSSGEICDEWAKKDKRVRVHYQENRGLAYVRNRGLELAQGEYIAWVDGDDYVDKRYLEVLINTLESNENDMVMCSFYTDTDGVLKHEGGKLFRAEEMDKQCFLERLYTYGMYSVVWNKLVSKKAYRDVQFPVGRVFEDSSVMCRLVSGCKKITVVEEPLYYYRRHDESIMLKKRSEADSIRYINNFYLWIKEDVAVHRKEKNEKLVALASRHFCDGIIKYSDTISKEKQAEWKKVYKEYAKEVLHFKGFKLMTKVKYFVAGISFSLYHQIRRTTRGGKKA